MSDFDVVIIGGGLAGLTAGLYLARGQHRTKLLEKDTFGGNIRNVEWIENYPGFAEGVAGAQLASEMVTQATECGLLLEQAEVVGLELYPSLRWVQCANGSGYTAETVIIAGGCRPKKLDVPGEEEFQGRGVITCAVCDARLYKDRVVAVCGGGDSGAAEALYMTKWASKVILIEVKPALTATAALKERVLANSKIDVHYGAKVEAIVGDSQVVGGIELIEAGSGERKVLKVDGILIHVGFEANTSYLQGIIPLDSQDKIIVNNKMETEAPGIFAAGDIRHGSKGKAADDGTTAALSAERFLRRQQSVRT